MRTTIYHNPSCTKCRLTLELLQEKGLEPDVINYLDTPPSVPELDDFLTKLGLEPRELMRTFEKPYQEADLDNPNLSREQLIQAMVQYPILIQRPIVVTDKGVAIGRPPETVLAVL